MKKLLLVALAALALSGCDNAPASKMITCLDSSDNNMQMGAAIDMASFPAFITVNGKRLYPDETIAVNNMGNITMYDFSKHKSDDNGYFVADEMQLQKSNNKWSDILYALNHGTFKQAYLIWKDGIKYGTYSHVELSYGNILVNNQMSGYCEAE